VTGDDLRRYGVRTIAEAMNFLSLGMASQDPNHSVEVSSRGVGFTADYGNHMLVIIDGHLINEPWNGTAYFEQGLGLPVEVIDRVELMVGPGSVLYGSYAMLGVVNVITKRAKDVGRVQLNVEGTAIPAQDVNAQPQLRIPGMGGAIRASALTGHELTLGGRTLELVFALEHYAHRGQSFDFPVQSGFTESDGTPTNYGPRAPAPGAWGGRTTDSYWTSVTGGILKVNWGDFSLLARGVRSLRNSPAMGTFGPIASDFDARAEEADYSMNLELRWSRQVHERVSLMIRGYFDLYSYDLYESLSSWSTYGSGADLGAQADPNNFKFTLTNPSAAQWGGIEAQTQIDWLGDGRFPLLVGIDARLRAYRSRVDYLDDANGNVIDSTSKYGVLEWMVAPYIQQRARVTSWLQLNAGLRVDTQSSFAPRLSPRLAVVATLPWEGRIKGFFSTAFRTPSGYERFTEYAGSTIKNPSLAPESVMTGELGYEQRIGRHRIFAGAFISKYSSMVRLVEAPAELAPNGESWLANAGEILNVGGNLLIEGAFGSFHYGLTFTGARNFTDVELPVAPAIFGNARLSYEFGERLPRLSLASFFAAPRLIDVGNNTGTDANGDTVVWTSRTAPAQADLRLTLDTPIPVRGLSLRVVIGTSLTPYSPYVAGPLLAPDPAISTTPTLNQNTRLFGMLTLSWNLDAP
jgi:outer membrane receptor for ferrienterochelin and colicins